MYSVLYHILKCAIDFSFEVLHKTVLPHLFPSCLSSGNPVLIRPPRETSEHRINDNPTPFQQSHHSWKGK